MEPTMTKRKIILLAVLGFLCIVYAVQMALTSGPQIKVFTMEESPDEITVSLPDGGSYSLLKQTGSAGDEKWSVKGRDYEADSVTVERMVRSLSSIKSPGKVSSRTEDTRFGLDDSSAVTVTALGQGKVLRSLRIGKASSSGTQTYAVIGDDSDVCLVSGNLRDVFDKTVDEVRSRLIFDMDQALVSKITVENQNGGFTLEKTGEPPVWSLAGGGGASSRTEVDTEKTASWVSSVLKLTALSFKDESVAEGAADGAVPAGTVVFTLQDKEVSLALYAPEEEEGSVYTAVCSESPWVFNLSSYTAERYLKNPQDFRLQPAQ